MFFGTDKRGAQRHTANFAAIIVLSNGERISCIVSNFSKSGALLLLERARILPIEFDLEAHDGPSKRVVVVRREASKVAVKFVVAE